MTRQLNMELLYGDKIVSIGEPHLACALLLDISDSMNENGAINSLNELIKRFKQQIDPIIANCVDIAIITFSDKVEIISDFVPISQGVFRELKAGGASEMAKGINVTIDLVKNRTKLYNESGTPCYRPRIFMITNGASTSTLSDMMSAAERIKMEENKGSCGSLTFWAVGMEGYDRKKLLSLTNKIVEIKSQDLLDFFEELSNYVFNYFHTFGRKIIQRIDENNEFGNLANNIGKKKDYSEVDDDWL